MKKNLLTIAALLALVYSPLLVAGEKCDPKSCSKAASASAKCDPKSCPPSPDCPKQCPESQAKATKAAQEKAASAKPTKA